MKRQGGCLWERHGNNLGGAGGRGSGGGGLVLPGLLHDSGNWSGWSSTPKGCSVAVREDLRKIKQEG